MGQKQKIIAIIVATLAIIAIGVFIFIRADDTNPAQNSQSNNNGGQIVGGDKDEHGCIGSAGYIWCEAKQKCLRPFEEFCPDAVKIIVAEIEAASGVELTSPTEASFNWLAGEGDAITDAKITGVEYSAMDVDWNDYQKIEKYLNDNIGLDSYNIADGITAGLRGYYTSYMACQLNFFRPERKDSQPEDSQVTVYLRCGFFNPNTISTLLAGQKIKELIAQKYDKAVGEISVNIIRNDEAHAAGQIDLAPGADGGKGMFLAVKDGSSWKLVYDGNGSIDCDKMKSNYGFSSDILIPEFCD